MRLTKMMRQKILNQNNGFKRQTHYEGKNSCESRIYTIENGQLHIQVSGKSSWADSHYKDGWIAGDEETHRFLYRYLGELNLDGLE